MTFRQPYNPDLLGPFDESMRKQDEHIAKNNAIHMDNVELGNETLEAISNLSTKGAGWITDMQEKKRLAAAGDEAGKYLTLKYNFGKKPINPQQLRNHNSQEDQLLLRNDTENAYQYWSTGEKGVPYEATSDLRWNSGVKPYFGSKLVLNMKMNGLGPHLNSIFGPQGTIKDPDRQYTIPETGRTFRLGDPDLSSDDFEFAYNTEFNRYMSDPQIADTPISMLAPYIDKVGQAKESWMADMQVKVNDRRSENDRRFDFNAWQHDKDLSKLFKEYRNTYKNGQRLEWKGAMDHFQAEYLELAGTEGFTMADYYSNVVGAVISPGHKDEGKTYGEAYPHRFLNPVYLRQLEKAAEKADHQKNKETTNYLNKIDQQLAETYTAKLDRYGNLPSADRETLQEMVLDFSYKHGDLWKGKRLDAILENTSEDKNPQRATEARSILERKEANFALTEEDINFAWSHLPTDEAKKWDTKITNYTTWAHGETYNKQMKTGMAGLFASEVLKLDLKGKDPGGMSTFIIQDMKDIFKNEYFSLMEKVDENGKIYTQQTAGIAATAKVYNWIKVGKQPGGILEQEGAKPGQIGRFNNYERYKLKDIEPSLLKENYGEQAAINRLQESEDIEVAQKISKSLGRPLYTFTEEITGESSPMAKYNNISSSILAYAIQNPQSWAANMRAQHDAKYGAETISNNYDPDISPIGKAALILTNQDGYYPEDGETAKEFDDISPEMLIAGYATNDNGTIDLEKVRIAKRVLYASGVLTLQDMTFSHILG